MMTTTIKVDGITCTVLNAYSSGPGCKLHTFDVADGGWVRCIAGVWTLHQPGQFPRVVTVEV